MFTEDAVWEAKGFGSWVGRDKGNRGGKSVVVLHDLTEVDLAADGRSALDLWEPATMPDEQTKQAEPHWITGVYDAEVVKVDGNWLFKRITSGMNMISPAKDGWVKTRFPRGSETAPYLTYLDAGTWCGGKSENQPFCDGSPRGRRSAAKKPGLRRHATHLGLDI